MLLAAALYMAAPTPAMRSVLTELGSFNAPPVESVEPRIAREAPGPNDAVAQLLSRRGLPTVEIVGDVSHRLVPTNYGGILLRIYRPRGSSASAKLPGLVYFHGGGFVISSINGYDASCRALANASGAEIISVGYRQAPENPYPAAWDDAVTATKFVMNNASSLGVNAGKIMVGGESAGGNLATAVCIRLKKEGAKLPKHQLLVYPVTDWTRSTDRSIEENAKAKPLNKAMLGWFKKFTYPDPSRAAESQASPYKATNVELKGLPAATFVFAQIDPLRQQGMDYAMKLKANGVKVDYRLYNGVTHEFFGMGAVVPQAKAAETYAANRLRAAAR